MTAREETLNIKELEKIWVELSSCRTRFMGTDGAAEAVTILRSHIDTLDLQPKDVSFEYQGWRPGNPVALKIDGREVEAYAMLGSHSESNGPVPLTGRLDYVGPFGVWGTYDWERFALVNVDDRGRAYVLGRRDGPAIPQTLPEGSARMPYVGVGSEALASILATQASGHAPEASIRTDASFQGVQEGVNLVTDLPEGGEHTVLIGAHYDSFFSTPGAYDNASGAACLASVASTFRSGIPDTKARLAWFGAEEWLLGGAKAYVERAHASDNLPELMINIDGVGRGNTLEVWYGPDSMLPELRRVIEPFAARQGFETAYVFPPPPGSDHAPFYDVGCAVCMLTFNDLEILHRPEDGIEARKLHNMLRTLDVVGGLLANINALVATIPAGNGNF